MQQLTVLGSTGSIGQSTLDVVAANRERFSVFALCAFNSADLLLEQILQFEPQYAVLVETSAADSLRSRLPQGTRTEVLSGRTALSEMASMPEVDVVVAAIVGAAGLEPTLAAVQASKKVLLANKESLVMAGALFMDEVEKSGAQLLPVDSEHNAIFQCLPANFQSLQQAGVRRLLLTGSGGPFRTFSHRDLEDVSPEQACAHPNWDMGKKISVDSATMMNKGLEFIEACWLFGAQASQIEVIVHPQSIIHSMVEFQDGSVLAQLGQPDMRTPIANCLGWPDRIQANVKPLNFFELGHLEFSKPDLTRFRCLAMAIESFSIGGSATAALNAANEVAVDAFLNGRLPFLAIADVVDHVMQKQIHCEPDCIAAVLHADAEARALAQDFLDSMS